MNENIVRCRNVGKCKAVKCKAFRPICKDQVSDSDCIVPEVGADIHVFEGAAWKQVPAKLKEC